MFISVKRSSGEPWFINTEHITAVEEKLWVTPGDCEVIQCAVLTFVNGNKLTMSVEDWQFLKKQIETEQRKQH